mmetsp:Transcript_859/g.2225  ORF Transcript_859/g.2225 Transcript_859/m.2225 type:complete len:293 (+) Transcript_859:695-1573(+)
MDVRYGGTIENLLGPVREVAVAAATPPCQYAVITAAVREAAGAEPGAADPAAAPADCGHGAGVAPRLPAQAVHAAMRLRQQQLRLRQRHRSIDGHGGMVVHLQQQRLERRVQKHIKAHHLKQVGAVALGFLARLHHRPVQRGHGVPRQLAQRIPQPLHILSPPAQFVHDGIEGALGAAAARGVVLAAAHKGVRVLVEGIVGEVAVDLVLGGRCWLLVALRAEPDQTLLAEKCSVRAACRGDQHVEAQIELHAVQEVGVRHVVLGDPLTRGRHTAHLGHKVLPSVGKEYAGAL